MNLKRVIGEKIEVKVGSHVRGAGLTAGLDGKPIVRLYHGQTVDNGTKLHWLKEAWFSPAELEKIVEWLQHDFLGDGK